MTTLTVPDLPLAALEHPYCATSGRCRCGDTLSLMPSGEWLHGHPGGWSRYCQRPHRQDERA